MNLDPTSCYRALLARDRRFDGAFFTCVRTTRIYCRPVCPARPPKYENCQFLATAAAAQEAGYRACLRCRPETAPDTPAWAGSSASVARALRLIEDGALDVGSVSDLALRLGLGERHLRRLFADHLGASPKTVALTRRILLAKQLLHDSRLGMTEIALASGFGSLRRFNEVFRQQFGRSPSLLRKKPLTRAASAPSLSVLLPYRPPYDWGAMLGFLRLRAIPGVERVENGVYRRTVDIDGQHGVVSVADDPARSGLKAVIRIDDLTSVPKIVARLRRLFDVGCDPAPIADVLSQDRLLAPLVARRPGLRLPGAWDSLELGVRAILGQQVSVTAASRLAGRLALSCGRPVSGLDKLDRCFPSARQLAQMDVGRAGFPRARAQAIVAFAQALIDDPALLDGSREPGQARARLEAIPGIGAWTANYIAMRALRDSDAFLPGDAALARIARATGLDPSRKALDRISENWRPWRAYGVLHLWTSEMEGRDDAAAA